MPGAEKSAGPFCGRQPRWTSLPAEHTFGIIMQAVTNCSLFFSVTSRPLAGAAACKAGADTAAAVATCSSAPLAFACGRLRHAARRACCRQSRQDGSADVPAAVQSAALCMHSYTMIPTLVWLSCRWYPQCEPAPAESMALMSCACACTAVCDTAVPEQLYDAQHRSHLRRPL